MAFWKFEPAAVSDDPRWLDFGRWREVIVRADTSALAIEAAARELGRPDAQIGNESPAARCGLEDEKLYHVRRLGPEEAAALPEGGPAVVRAIAADAAAERRRDP